MGEGKRFKVRKNFLKRDLSKWINGTAKIAEEAEERGIKKKTLVNAKKNTD